MYKQGNYIKTVSTGIINQIYVFICRKYFFMNKVFCLCSDSSNNICYFLFINEVKLAASSVNSTFPFLTDKLFCLSMPDLFVVT